ncbi:helicase ARIP4-like [Leguminivora glycinivorella]|uniref:helicase ARIP4-like n=1 Tax=Leguminivora glycinivorella TaxID=1035111 RepID=UPI00200D4ED9|nr:helicase ARIP4-like [Leguminivora glycinivorella]
MSDGSGSSSGNKRKGKSRDEEGSDEDTWDSDDDDDTIARIQRAHFAQAAAMRGRRRSNPRPRPMSNKRKLEAVKQFHDFTKKLKKDTGVTIRSLVGNNILELSDFSSEDSKSDSDGLSEEEFVVNPTAVEELNQEDESYIDPETGDFVQSKKSVEKPPKPASPEPELVPAVAELPEEKKTLSISDIISDGDLDLTKNVEISEVEESELCPEKAEELLDMKNEGDSQDFDITEKLKEMGEISVKPIKKDDEEDKPPSEEDKNAEADDDKKQNSNALNMRRNIRDVMDEKNLDASTLAAQRQESERLARVQEQQRIIREVQRQIAINRQNKIHQKTLSLLQGGSSILKKGPGQKLNLPNTVLVKLPSGEMKKTTMRSGQVEVTKLPKPTTSGAAKSMKPDQKTDKKEQVVEIVDSSSGEDSSSSASDSDDCIIMLSGDSIESTVCMHKTQETTGLHVKDAYNTPDEQGRVLINLGHPENEEDIFLAPQIARVIKPHQIGGVRFLFDNIIESTERFSTSTGFGCILAHSMGLGKPCKSCASATYFYGILARKLCYVAEFNMWLPTDAATSPLAAHGEVRPRNFPIYVLNDSHKTLQMRAKVVKDWTTTGGVLMIGYELYRLLSMKKDKKPRKKKKPSSRPKRKRGKNERRTKIKWTLLMRTLRYVKRCF